MKPPEQKSPKDIKLRRARRPRKPKTDGMSWYDTARARIGIAKSDPTPEGGK
jgi:hypothetical protein